jgi:hypothetical protein
MTYALLLNRLVCKADRDLVEASTMMEKLWADPMLLCNNDRGYLDTKLARMSSNIRLIRSAMRRIATQ